MPLSDMLRWILWNHRSTVFPEYMWYELYGGYRSSTTVLMGNTVSGDPDHPMHTRAQGMCITDVYT